MAEFTHRHPTDGNVSIGTLSSQYSDALDDIANQYLASIEDKTATTHHTYYTDLSGTLLTNFERIQTADYWQGLRVGAFDQPNTFAVIMKNMPQMNEVYYSNPKPNFENAPLYGAAANLIPHRDCILFAFPGIRVYRAIISATNGNNDTATEFINHGVERRLNRGDYMVFDFDRTLHRVKKTGQTATSRVLLKLHFLVLDMEYAHLPCVWVYVKFASACYVVYYRVARYTEQIGTDPKTFAGFFFGILWEYPFYPRVRQGAANVYLWLVLRRAVQLVDAPLLKISDLQSSSVNLIEIAMYSVLDMAAIYFCIALWFWLSYLWQKYIYSTKEDK